MFESAMQLLFTLLPNIWLLFSCVRVSDSCSLSLSFMSPLFFFFFPSLPFAIYSFSNLIAPTLDWS